jgi:hypothetical protein
MVLGSESQTISILHIIARQVARFCVVEDTPISDRDVDARANRALAPDKLTPSSQSWDGQSVVIEFDPACNVLVSARQFELTIFH